MTPQEPAKKLTVDELMQILCEAAVPLEALNSVERYQPWLSLSLQEGIDTAVRRIREVVIRYNRERITCQVLQEEGENK